MSDKWVKVGESLPSNGEMVLYSHSAKLGNEIIHCRFDKRDVFGNPGMFVREYEGRWMYSDSAYWMPAPDLP